jgi:ankyrin repeat protein
MMMFMVMMIAASTVLCSPCSAGLQDDSTGSVGEVSPSAGLGIIQPEGESSAFLTNEDKFLDAVIEGDAVIVAAMLDAGTADPNGDPQRGIRPLVHAALVGNDAVLSLLLDRGADVNALDDEGQSALFFACVGRSTNAVRLLLEHGVSAETINKNSVGGGTPLTVASEKGDAEIVNILIARGAVIDQRTDTGSTALLKAAHCGKVAVVKMLLDKGASVNAANDLGQTALMLAAHEDHAEVVRLLLASGASKAKECRQGMTARDYAGAIGEDQHWSRSALAVLEAT